MSITRKVPFSFASRIPSSSMNDACSTEFTPARIARLMPSAPCACAATRRSHMCASWTTASSSSWEYWGAPSDSSSESTPAVASTLITSAPCRTFGTNQLADRVDPVRDAAEGLERQIRRVAVEIAVAARRAQGQTGHQHPRPRDVAVIDGFLQRDVDVFLGPDVTNRREPRLERPPGIDVGQSQPRRWGCV